MAVQKHDFEGCCTADILTSFGESHTSEYGYSAAEYDKLWAQTVVKVNGSLRHGIVTAILTSEQTTAAKVLKDLGFTGTGPAKKDRHPEVTIELFYLHVQGWKEPAKPAEHQEYAAKAAPEAPVVVVQPFAQARQANPQPERPRGPDGRWIAARDIGEWLNDDDEQPFVPQKYKGYLIIQGQRRYVIRFFERTGAVQDGTNNPGLATLFERDELGLMNERRVRNQRPPIRMEAV